MKRSAILSLVLVAVLLLGAGLGTYAWFTSTATSNTEHFKTGTLKLDNEGTFEMNLGDAIVNMQPGDISAPVIIDILNDGSLNLAWIGKFEIPVSLNSEKLSKAIYIHDMKMEFLKPSGTNSWEPAYHFIKDGAGKDWYIGLQALDGLNVISLDTWINKNNEWAVNKTGLFMGALKPENSYRLTFQLGMAPLANSTYQGIEMDLKYVVEATQVKKEALQSLGLVLSEEQFNWFNNQIIKQ